MDPIPPRPDLAAAQMLVIVSLLAVPALAEVAWEVDVHGRDYVHVLVAANLTCCAEGEQLDEWWIESPFPVEGPSLVAFDLERSLNVRVAPTGVGTGLVVALNEPLLRGRSQVVAVEYDAAVPMSRGAAVWTLSGILPLEGGGTVRMVVMDMEPLGYRTTDGEVFAPSRDGNITLVHSSQAPPNVTFLGDGSLALTFTVEEAPMGLLDLELTISQKLSCDIGAGLTCENDPDLCPCPGGWSCEPGAQASTPRGCYSPDCGNGVCDEGECLAGCVDCNLTQCAGDGACTLALGERCDTSPDCACAANGFCDPADPRSDSQGCFLVTCTDDICDFEVKDLVSGNTTRFGECAQGCTGCNVTVCARDPECNLKVGENCNTSIDCPCLQGALCDPVEPRANITGCFFRKCGDSVCDVDLGECGAGCADCNLTICKADPGCNTAIGEDCAIAPDQCTCPTDWQCMPDHANATEKGCYNELCGNDVCERELGECDSHCIDCGTDDCLGDGECSAYHNETCAISVDCACASGKVCDIGRDMTDAAGCAAVVCGDERCEGGENSDTCPVDCGAEEEQRLLVPEGPEVVRTSPGGTVTVTVSVKNEGDADVPVKLIAWGAAADWTSLEDAHPTLFKGATIELYATVTVPKFTETGTYKGRIEIQRAGLESQYALYEVEVMSESGYCGDGTCQPGEDCKSCSDDCDCVPSMAVDLPTGTVFATIGEEGSFTIRVRNTGSVELHDVLLNLTGIPGKPDKNRVAAIPTGAHATFTVSFAIEEQGSFTAKVEVTSKEGPKGSGTATVSIGDEKAVAKGLGEELDEAEGNIEVELERFDTMKKEVSSTQFAMLEERLQNHLKTAQDELDEARRLADAGDMMGAQAHLVQARTEMETFRTLATSVPKEEGGWGRFIMFVGVLAVLAGGAGLFIISRQQAAKAKEASTAAQAATSAGTTQARGAGYQAQQSTYGYYQYNRPYYRYDYYQRQQQQTQSQKGQ